MQERREKVNIRVGFDCLFCFPGCLLTFKAPSCSFLMTKKKTDICFNNSSAWNIFWQSSKAVKRDNVGFGGLLYGPLRLFVRPSVCPSVRFGYQWPHSSQFLYRSWRDVISLIKELPHRYLHIKFGWRPLPSIPTQGVAFAWWLTYWVPSTTGSLLVAWGPEPWS